MGMGNQKSQLFCYAAPIPVGGAGFVSPPPRIRLPKGSASVGSHGEDGATAMAEIASRSDSGRNGWIRGDILIWKVQKKTKGAKL